MQILFTGCIAAIITCGACPEFIPVITLTSRPEHFWAIMQLATLLVTTCYFKVNNLTQKVSAFISEIITFVFVAQAKN